MSSKKINVLIIDDEKDLCLLLSNILISKGYEVGMKHLLQEGLQEVGETRPDWVILDNNLPDGLGWSKVSWIRENSPESKIIKISADPESIHDTDYKKVFYLVKPIKFNSILEILQATA
jgi:DNA-binding response OmpR family regulator